MTVDEPFDIAWSSTARRDLTRLPEKIAIAVVEFVYGAMSDEPERVGHRLRFALEGLHSANRGDYRIIHKVDVNERVVTVLALDHRSKVYRPR